MNMILASSTRLPVASKHSMKVDTNPPSKTETTTAVANKQAYIGQTFIKYSRRNHGYCMAIMQVAVVACLGVTETPGRSAVNPRNETLDGSLSEGAD